MDLNIIYYSFLRNILYVSLPHTTLHFMKKKILIALIVIALISGGYFLYSRFFGHTDGDLISNETVTVTRENITDAIQVNGKAEFAREQKMRFGTNGKVSAVYVKPGQAIKKWDLLAELDKRDFKQDSWQANSRYQMTSEKYSELKKKIVNFDIGKLQREVDVLDQKMREAQKDLVVLTKNAPLKTEEKQLTLADKKRDYTGKLATYELAKQALDNDMARKADLIAVKLTQNQKAIENIILSAPGDLNDLKNGVKEINRIFGFNQNEMSGEDRNKAVYVSRDRPDLRTATNSVWRDLVDSTKNTETFVINLDRNSKNPQDAKNTLETMIPAYKIFLATADAARRAIDTTVVGQEFGLSNADLESIKTNISNQRNTAYTKLSAFQESKATLTSNDDPKLVEQKVIAELESRKRNLETDFSTLSKLDVDIKKEENWLGNKNKTVDDTTQREIEAKKREISDLNDSLIAKRQELSKLTGGKSDELRNLQNDLTQQSIELEKMKTKIESYEIRAAFDGTVRTVKMKVGDMLNYGGTTNTDEGVIYIENADRINIMVSLDQLDIVKVKVGQSASIRFSAFPDQVFSGAITEIANTPSTADASSVSYVVTVSTARDNQPIYTGMSASVDIELSKKENIITIPLTAVNYNADTQTPYVTIVQENGNTEKRTIEVGSPSKNKIEVLSGLKEGEQIKVIDFTVNTSKGEDFGGGPMGGMMGM